MESSFDFANERGFNKEEIFSTFSTLLKKIGGSTSFYEMENVFYQGREWYNKRSLLDKYILELKGSGMNLEEGNVLLEKLSNKYNNFLPSDLLQLTTNSLDSMKNSAFISQEKIGVLLEASNILDENNFKDFTMHALPILVENKLTSEEITFLLNDLKRDIDKQDLWKALYNVEDIVKNSDWEENPSSYVNLEISNPRNDLFEVIGEEKEKIKQETGENPNPSGIDEKQYNQVKSAFDLYEKTTNSKIGKFLSKATGTNEEIKSLG
ncbi:MAG: hypothetical protein KJ566_01615, partial [Nanoarchaeota archaeon]|nr:hypothetical protein [Nanoarchaeota archaeon]